MASTDMKVGGTAVPDINGKAEAPHQKLRLGSLTALVVGSMIGSGVFSLPQNMAAGAGPLAIIIGWAITAVGMLALVFVYQSLATRKPDLNAGPYAYAKAGFGPFVGFNSAWGYWLSAWIGNVSYAVVVFSALSYFFPSFGDGNTWQAIIGASVLLWLVHALIMAGIREAAVVNLIVTVAKIAPIVLFIGVVVVAFKVDVFSADFSGLGNASLGSITDQVKSTMLVTLWVFIGIEGASVYSARAERRKDIATATITGFLTCLALYALVSLLSLGILNQPELAALKNPSMAGVLEAVVGPWGAVLINIALVVSVAGAFLSWTLLAAEIPLAAAKDGTMPAFFAKENSRGVPSTSLLITNLLVQAFLLVTLFAQSTYQALFSIASAAILVPYIFSGAYAAKLAMTGEAYQAGENRTGPMIVGLVATIYGLWLVYAAGPAYLFMCAVLYAPGIIFYAAARRQAGQQIFKPVEALLAVVLVAVGLLAAYQMWTGAVSPF
ncbi:arginine:ornithine antiporter/lysine permease [Rhizobium petrolearium]|uniref:arginine-ornithine antiporter n=1 Tax=Neorhizobium petrolearium TaxID=515361 RepID=UPI001FDC0CEF|nr:arginine-ornithine antiporter [Neorhizobium petrolearium]MBP1842786.1 arginine:ornithine antiporter/lysine permease [Neorhizobium petrolearium]